MFRLSLLSLALLFISSTVAPAAVEVVDFTSELEIARDELAANQSNRLAEIASSLSLFNETFDSQATPVSELEAALAGTSAHDLGHAVIDADDAVLWTDGIHHSIDIDQALVTADSSELDETAAPGSALVPLLSSVSVVVDLATIATRAIEGEVPAPVEEAVTLTALAVSELDDAVPSLELDAETFVSAFPYVASASGGLPAVTLFNSASSVNSSETVFSLEGVYQDSTFDIPISADDVALIESLSSGGGGGGGTSFASLTGGIGSSSNNSSGGGGGGGGGFTPGAVPEPSVVLLLVTALTGFVTCRRRRQRISSGI